MSPDARPARIEIRIDQAQRLTSIPVQMAAESLRFRRHCFLSLRNVRIGPVRPADSSMSLTAAGRGRPCPRTRRLFEIAQQEHTQGLPFAVVEEIAYENGWISRDELLESSERYGESPYGWHLRDITEDKVRLVQNR